MELRNMRHQRLRNGGFTLIELMVAMVIGMVVMGAGIGLLKTSASQKHMISNAAYLQEEAFFLSHVLKQQIAQVGYRPIDPARINDRTMPLDEVSVSFPEVDGEWAAGQLVKVEGDDLYYRFHGASNDVGDPDGSVFDCLGNAIGAGVFVENQLSLQGNTITCTVGAETQTIFGSDDGVLVEDVVVELGIDDTNDALVDRYIVSTAATDEDFMNVRQLNFRVLLATPDRVATSNQTYSFNGIETTSTDKKLRLEAEIFMEIRNK